MAARSRGKSYLLGIGYHSAGTKCRVVFCVVTQVSTDYGASWCFLVREGQSYKGKHCSLVGIQYVNIKTRVV